MHWWTLSLVGNQFIDLNSARDKCCILSNLRQNRIHLFCIICIVFFVFSVRFGYEAVHSYSKCGWISALQSILRSSGLRNLFFLERNFSFPFILFATFNVIGSPDIDLTNTSKICYLCLLLCIISLHLIFSLRIFLALPLLLLIDLVLSSSKWMLNGYFQKSLSKLVSAIFHYFKKTNVFLP